MSFNNFFKNFLHKLFFKSFLLAPLNDRQINERFTYTHHCREIIDEQTMQANDRYKVILRELHLARHAARRLWWIYYFAKMSKALNCVMGCEDIEERVDIGHELLFLSPYLGISCIYHLINECRHRRRSKWKSFFKSFRRHRPENNNPVNQLCVKKWLSRKCIVKKDNWRLLKLSLYAHRNWVYCQTVTRGWIECIRMSCWFIERASGEERGRKKMRKKANISSPVSVSARNSSNFPEHTSSTTTDIFYCCHALSTGGRD